MNMRIVWVIVGVVVVVGATSPILTVDDGDEDLAHFDMTWLLIR